MTMYGKVQPDKLGRPSSVWFSSHAAQVMGSGPWQVEAEADYLLLTHSQAGRSLGKSRLFRLGALLDQYNHDGKLSNLPFPVRRRSNGVFELLLRAPDATLSTRGAERTSALPMQLVEAPILQRQAHSTSDLVRLFALAVIIEEEELTEAAWRGGGSDLLARLPRYDSVMARFGSWSRFKSFVDFQVSRIRRSRAGAQAAHEELERLLEG